MDSQLVFPYGFRPMPEDGAYSVTIIKTGGQLEVVFRAAAAFTPSSSFFVALGCIGTGGSAVIPFGEGAEGSTVFLPFRANHILLARREGGEDAARQRVWNRTVWAESEPGAFAVAAGPNEVSFTVTLDQDLMPGGLRTVAYLKEMAAGNGWGAMLANPQQCILPGEGDAVIPKAFRLPEGMGDGEFETTFPSAKPRIYQLLPRLFSNTNERRMPNGTAAENGCGKFSEINDAAISSIAGLGFTHLWLTGVLQQATATAFPLIGLGGDDPDLLKGLAGSPYAIKDYYDVSPDYAEMPETRVAEFRALVHRIHRHGLKVLIDFVPNHVSRCYHSDVRPAQDFGIGDDRSKFFDPRNHFFYLQPEHEGHGPPLFLPTVRDGQVVSPTCQVLGTCDGRYEGELHHGCVTGNNAVTWAPRITDWYETIKLNFGFDFTTGAREYPNGEFRDKPWPATWVKMDEIIAYWQGMGVDGFRCDMAHMVPPEFWGWAIDQARKRNPEVYFAAEAYNNDPAKVLGGDPLLNSLCGGHGHVMIDLLSSGFDAVYDDPSYKALKAMFDGSGWANDLDGAFPHPYIFHRSLRYAENHDEVRLAAAGEWGGIGSRIGPPISAILYGLGRGPLLLYHGQESGEPGAGAEGFGGDNGRTTIFDYWCMPEHAKWVNQGAFDGGRLSAEQKTLRAFYGRLVTLCGRAAFAEGAFFPLNPANLWNDKYGRLPGETASGHWLYAFVRSTGLGGEHFLVVVNLHSSETLGDIRILLSTEALAYMGLGERSISLHDRLGPTESAFVCEIPASTLRKEGVAIKEIAPLTAFYCEITTDPGIE